MKHKYKLGTFIQFTGAKNGSEVGLVNGILTTLNGNSYRTESSEEFIPENQVVNAYRQIKARSTGKVHSISKRKAARKESATA